MQTIMVENYLDSMIFMLLSMQLFIIIITIVGESIKQKLAKKGFIL